MNNITSKQYNESLSVANLLSVKWYEIEHLYLCGEWSTEGDRSVEIQEYIRKMASGVYAMGKILTICRKCLLTNTEPNINRQILNEVGFYILGNRVEF